MVRLHNKDKGLTNQSPLHALLPCSKEDLRLGLCCDNCLHRALGIATFDSSCKGLKIDLGKMNKLLLGCVD